MKPNEPSRTALMIARQRAGHQALDQGSILNDPFAMKILSEDEKGRASICEQTPIGQHRTPDHHRAKPGCGRCFDKSC